MRVLLVDLEIEWRGGQNQALLLLRGLRDRGHEAELLTANGSALRHRASQAGITVHPVSRGVFRLPAARKIRELLRSGRYDIVHANEAHAVTAAWLAAWRRRAPTKVRFVISRRVGYPIGKGPLAQARYLAADRIVAISQWSAERVARSGIPADKITVVYEGVELPALPSAQRRAAARSRFGVAQDDPLLGCVGVLSPDKGQEWLIRALALVRKKFPGAKLVLAGDGPCRKKLELLTRELGLENAVVFTGFVSDVESIYAALDVFLLPSFFEALSNALMSAMAYGIPSIAFHSGGPAEIIENEKSGLLVSGPDAEEISSAVSRILPDRDLASRFSKAGRARIEQKFSAGKMVEAMLHVYEECRRNNSRQMP